MVTLKQATVNAIEFARELLGEYRTEDIRVEEVESIKTEGVPAWRITMSMLKPSDDKFGGSGGIAGISGGGIASLLAVQRDYRTFTVLKENGEVRSMKMRIKS